MEEKAFGNILDVLREFAPNSIDTLKALATSDIRGIEDKIVHETSRELSAIEVANPHIRELIQDLGIDGYQAEFRALRDAFAEEASAMDIGPDADIAHPQVTFDDYDAAADVPMEERQRDNSSVPPSVEMETLPGQDTAKAGIPKAEQTLSVDTAQPQLTSSDEARQTIKELGQELGGGTANPFDYIAADKKFDSIVTAGNALLGLNQFTKQDLIKEYGRIDGSRIYDDSMAKIQDAMNDARDGKISTRDFIDKFKEAYQSAYETKSTRDEVIRDFRKELDSAVHATDPVSRNEHMGNAYRNFVENRGYFKEALVEKGARESDAEKTMDRLERTFESAFEEDRNETSAVSEKLTDFSNQYAYTFNGTKGMQETTRPDISEDKQKYLDRAEFWAHQSKNFVRYRSDIFRNACMLGQSYNRMKAASGGAEKGMAVAGFVGDVARFLQSNLIETIVLELVKIIVEYLSGEKVERDIEKMIQEYDSDIDRTDVSEVEPDPADTSEQDPDKAEVTDEDNAEKTEEDGVEKQEPDVTEKQEGNDVETLEKEDVEAPEKDNTEAQENRDADKPDVDSTDTRDQDKAEKNAEMNAEKPESVEVESQESDAPDKPEEEADPADNIEADQDASERPDTDEDHTESPDEEKDQLEQPDEDSRVENPEGEKDKPESDKQQVERPDDGKAVRPEDGRADKPENDKESTEKPDIDKDQVDKHEKDLDRSELPDAQEDQAKDPVIEHEKDAAEQQMPGDAATNETDHVENNDGWDADVESAQEQGNDSDAVDSDKSAEDISATEASEPNVESNAKDPIDSSDVIDVMPGQAASSDDTDDDGHRISVEEAVNAGEPTSDEDRTRDSNIDADEGIDDRLNEMFSDYINGDISAVDMMDMLGSNMSIEEAVLSLVGAEGGVENLPADTMDHVTDLLTEANAYTDGETLKGLTTLADENPDLGWDIEQLQMGMIGKSWSDFDFSDNPMDIELGGVPFSVDSSGISGLSGGESFRNIEFVSDPVERSMNDIVRDTVKNVASSEYDRIEIPESNDIARGEDVANKDIDRFEQPEAQDITKPDLDSGIEFDAQDVGSGYAGGSIPPDHIDEDTPVERTQPMEIPESDGIGDSVEEIAGALL